MSDNHDLLRTGTSNSERLRADGLALMLKGAGYAAVVVLAVWFGLTVIYWVGNALPDESRDVPDPTPFSFYLTDQTVATV